MNVVRESILYLDTIISIGIIEKSHLFYSLLILNVYKHIIESMSAISTSTTGIIIDIIIINKNIILIIILLETPLYSQ